MTLDTEEQPVGVRRTASITRYDDNKVVMRLGLHEVQQFIRVLGKGAAANPGIFGQKVHDHLRSLLTDDEANDLSVIKTDKLNSPWLVDKENATVKTAFKIERHNEDHFQFTIEFLDAKRLTHVLGLHTRGDEIDGLFSYRFFENDFRAIFEDVEWNSITEIKHTINPYGIIDDRRAD